MFNSFAFCFMYLFFAFEGEIIEPLSHDSEIDNQYSPFGTKSASLFKREIGCSLSLLSSTKLIVS
jgi:hypothetical protein